MRKAWSTVAAAAVALAVAAFVISTGGEAGGSTTREHTRARATLNDAAGAEIGEVKLRQRGDSVEIKLEIQGAVTPGFHGFHVHSVGACIAPFTTAGGHYNPGGATHRDHAGDLPVLYVDADGEAEARVSTDRFAVNDLFDADGSAFILHAGPDNYANIPTDRYDPDADATTLATGDAGGRIGCGVIGKK
jgi:Cu-Zn family superoxide dismutase